MKSIFKRSLTATVVVLIIMQLWHPALNTNTTINNNDITRAYTVPDNVHQVLQRACYDCHSNSTKYPWYNKVQPISWWLNDHVKEGKQHLNFSEFGTYSTQRKAKKLVEVAGTISEGEMPLGSYTIIHRDAVLNDAEKALIIGWATNLANQIADTVKKQ